MDKTKLKQSFVKLKLAGYQIKEISKILEIPERTAYRWANSVTVNLADLISAKESEGNQKISQQIDVYIDYLNKHFNILNTELSFHRDIHVPYPRILQHSIDIFNSIQKLVGLKKILPKNLDLTEIDKIAENIIDDLEDAKENNT